MTRENNFDLLRILCTIGVILLHISSIFMNGVTSEASLGGIYEQNIWEVTLFYIAPRFAVPCFVMLSGAFILADDRNVEFTYFYKKSWKKIGIPTLVFSAGYTVVSIVTDAVMLGALDGTILWASVKNWLMGFPYYHMWYLYMLIGLYLMAPVVLMLRKQIQEETFERVSWCVLIAGVLCEITSTHLFFWDFSRSFCYLGYFMMGYVLRNKFLSHKKNTVGICNIVSGVLILYATSILWYKKLMVGEMAMIFGYSIAEPMSPLVACASIMIFMGFSLLQVKWDFSKMAADTFYIYLIHAVFVAAYRVGIAKTLGTSANAILMIPLGVFVTYVASALCAKVYIALEKRIFK